MARTFKFMDKEYILPIPKTPAALQREAAEYLNMVRPHLAAHDLDLTVQLMKPKNEWLHHNRHDLDSEFISNWKGIWARVGDLCAYNSALSKGIKPQINADMVETYWVEIEKFLDVIALHMHQKHGLDCGLSRDQKS